jgi:UDP:flavonoid glycosyltransferase YjiC (YdhE family)
MGHATRMVTLANLMKKQFNIEFSSFGAIPQYIRKLGFKCNEVPDIEVQWNSQGELSLKKTSLHLFPSLPKFLRQINIENKFIKNFKPKLIVSDSRLSTVIASKYLNLDNIVILNQLKLLIPTHYQSNLKTFVENVFGEIIGKVWAYSNNILLPDLPPPYTISETNLWGVRSVSKKIKYVGFMVEKPIFESVNINKIIKNLELNNNKPIIFAPISGPANTRLNFTNTIINLASKLSNKYNFIISGGNPTGSDIPKKIPGGWYYDWCSIKDELYEISDIILGRAGHLTIGQSIVYGKPMISVPIYNYSEQLSNSLKINKLGIGVTLNERTSHINDYSHVIEDVLYDMNIKKQVKKLQNMTERYNGLKNLSNIISSYS